MKSQIATVVILIMIFSIALTIRLEPMKYGQLNEFDPFWNYQATEYLIDNGWDSYKNWYDEKSWYGVPNCPIEIIDCGIGRNVSATSQEGLHLTTAFLYNFYDGDLYSFTILIPAIFGALTVLPIYVLVSQLGKSKTAGLIASLFYAVTFGILIRNMAGWFKSEPLGLLLALSFLAGFTCIYYKNKIDLKIIALAILLGLLITFSISSWVGSAILIMPLMILGLVMPIFVKDGGGLGKLLLVIGGSSLIPMLFFERAESLFLPMSMALIGLGGFNLISFKIPKILKIVLVISVMALVLMALLGSDISDRYKTTLIPFNFSDNKLVASVSEHSIPSSDQIYFMQAYYVLLAPIGLVTYILTKKFDLMNKIWMYVLVGTLLYFGISLIRLQMIMSIGLIIISSIGIVLLLNYMRKLDSEKNLRTIGFVVLLSFMILPISLDWIEKTDLPPSILTGASQSTKATTEWIQALDFIEKLPEDSKIFAWWDYGYWISVMGDKTTFMDNSTLYTNKIEEYAKIFTMPPDEAHAKLKEIEADYVLVFSTTTKTGDTYDFFGGGDELKSFWIFEIAETKHAGLINHFFVNTLMGSMIPFLQNQDGEYRFTPKYITENEELFQAVYVSPSYYQNEDGVRYGILIYKVL